MSAKLFNFPAPKPQPAGTPVDLPSIRISLGGEVYEVNLAAVIRRVDAGAKNAKPAEARMIDAGRTTINEECTNSPAPEDDSASGDHDD